jgi:hypothetical protein
MAASFDLGELWQYYCAKAMGFQFDWDDHYGQRKKIDELQQQEQQQEEEGTKRQNNKTTNKQQDGNATNYITFVSLIPPAAAPHPAAEDAWMETAQQVQVNIDEMKWWIRNKANDYLSLHMPDQEASLIQSTVTSFCAQTANEIESLHAALLSSSSSASTSASASQSSPLSRQHHRRSIVQILMANLQEYVADPFKQMSKRRKRPAVSIWQTPLQCRRSTTTNHENSANVPFAPTRPSHRLHLDFWDAYYIVPAAVTSSMTRPKSIFDMRNEEAPVPIPITRPAAAHPGGHRRPGTTNSPPRPTTRDATSSSSLTTTDQAVLQQEAILLQQVTTNDLDAVYKWNK